MKIRSEFEPMKQRSRSGGSDSNTVIEIARFCSCAFRQTVTKQQRIFYLITKVFCERSIFVVCGVRWVHSKVRATFFGSFLLIFEL